MGPSIVSYKHSLHEFHTLCQQSLGLNNVTYLFHNVFQVLPLGWETVNIGLYILKDFDFIKF